MESIQTVNIPGWNIQTTQTPNLSNLKGVDFSGMGQKPSSFVETTINRFYAGNGSINDIVDSNILNVTFRNTMINWMYLYEALRGYYDRTRNLSLFRITITLMNTAEIPLLQFIYSDCMVAVMPGLEFSFTQAFMEAKTIDTGFIFNKVDVNFLIPNFDLLNPGNPTILNNQ